MAEWPLVDEGTPEHALAMADKACECGDELCASPINVGAPCNCDACIGRPISERLGP